MIAVYTVPSLADVLTRAAEEVQQIVAGVGPAEQLNAVRKAVCESGCVFVYEIMEDTNLSRHAVDRALRELVASGVIEERTPYLLADVAEEPGRPATQYHPADSPRGEDFTHRLYSAAEDNLL